MIGIIDYGLGNVKAFSYVYDKLRIKNLLLRNIQDFENVDKLILPGVGSFDSAIKLINNSKIKEKLQQEVIEKKKPILGICIGMQVFAKKSSEGTSDGFSWFDAEVIKLQIKSNYENKLKLPHMGWNSIDIKKKNQLFENINNNEYFYFLHSYFFECFNKSDVIAETTFDNIFPSAVNNGNIYGIQFHPEKSHDAGIKILENFALL